MDTSKRLIIKIGLIFVGILLFLTFFSKTIYDFNLSSVVVEYPREGAITRTADGRGTVDFAVQDSYYANVPGKVYLLAAEGQNIEVGGALYSIVADTEDLRQELAKYTLDAETWQVRLDKARADRTYAQRNLSSLSLSTAQQALADALLLFEAGAISQRELDEKQAALDKATEEYNQQSQELQNNLSGLAYDIEEYELALASNLQEIARLEEQINARGSITVKAENSGVVRQISAAADNGAFLGKNELIMRVGVPEGGYKTLFELPESANFLNIGDTVTFSISSRNLYGLSGQITALGLSDGRLRAEVKFAAEDIRGGETAEIKVQNTSQLYSSILPNSALRSDSYGDYVLYAEQVKSLLGYEYYARRTNAWISEQNNYDSAVGIYSNKGSLPVIINSDKPVSEGDRVRIVGGSDLVAIR